jgi:hypothetical protein
LKISQHVWVEAVLVVALIAVSLLFGVELISKPPNPAVVTHQMVNSTTNDSGTTFEGSLRFTVPSHGGNFTRIGVEVALNVSCFDSVYCLVSFVSLANLVWAYQTHLTVSLPSNSSVIQFDSVPGPSELTVTTGFASQLGGPVVHPGEDEFHAMVTVFDYGS